MFQSYRLFFNIAILEPKPRCDVLIVLELHTLTGKIDDIVNIVTTQTTNSRVITFSNFKIKA